MREASATRRELEQSLRSLLPVDLPFTPGAITENSTVAVAGVGGLLSGYVWGWIRGRRTRRKRQR